MEREAEIQHRVRVRPAVEKAQHPVGLVPRPVDLVQVAQAKVRHEQAQVSELPKPAGLAKVSAVEHRRLALQVAGRDRQDRTRDPPARLARNLVVEAVPSVPQKAKRVAVEAVRQVSDKRSQIPQGC